jgi:hypothetical protein
MLRQHLRTLHLHQHLVLAGGRRSSHSRIRRLEADIWACLEVRVRLTRSSVHMARPAGSRSRAGQAWRQIRCGAVRANPLADSPNPSLVLVQHLRPRRGSTPSARWPHRAA